MAALPDPGVMVPRPFRVERKARETYDTWTLSLAPVEGAPIDIVKEAFHRAHHKLTVKTQLIARESSL